MNTKFEFGKDKESENIVYIRRVAVSSLPEEVQAQVEGVDNLYAVHGADGSRLALVQDRGLAFMLAREHELSPVSAH